MHAMKSPCVCADVVSVMEHDAEQSTTNPPSEPKRDADHIAVSAEELLELIRSGEGFDVNELVRRTLLDRHAA